METYAEFVPMLKALADEKRLKIIDMLSCGQLCACKILEKFNFSQPALSRHMKVLCKSGLVTGVRDGAWMHYTLNKEKYTQLLQFITYISYDKANCIVPEFEDNTYCKQ
jgi:ArsR family transcriptional regulator, arsenate/arsenite/antimonite-responsive transcriptional repressor